MIPHELEYLLIAALLGLIVGLERAIKHKIASVRTFALFSTGCCLMSMLSEIAAAGFNRDPTRIAAGILSGLGFLGGGIIFKSESRVEGITTASMLWLTAGMGMCCGFGYTLLAIYSLFVYIIILIVGKIIHKLVDRFSIHKIHDGE